MCLPRARQQHCTPVILALEQGHLLSRPGGHAWLRPLSLLTGGTRPPPLTTKARCRTPASPAPATGYWPAAAGPQDRLTRRHAEHCRPPGPPHRDPVQSRAYPNVTRRFCHAMGGARLVAAAAADAPDSRPLLSQPMGCLLRGLRRADQQMTDTVCHRLGHGILTPHLLLSSHPTDVPACSSTDKGNRAQQHPDRRDSLPCTTLLDCGCGCCLPCVESYSLPHCSPGSHLRITRPALLKSNRANTHWRENPERAAVLAPPSTGDAMLATAHCPVTGNGGHTTPLSSPRLWR